MSDVDPKITIADNLEKPKKGQNNMGTFEQHPLKDQIEAAKFLASEENASGRLSGMKVQRFNMPGTE